MGTPTEARRITPSQYRDIGTDAHGDMLEGSICFIQPCKAKKSVRFTTKEFLSSIVRERAFSRLCIFCHQKGLTTEHFVISVSCT